MARIAYSANLFKISILVGCLFLSFATPLMAATIEDGFAAANRGDYTTELQIFAPLADQGNPEAQFMLGNMYLEGTGITKSFIEASKWYRKSAEQGFSKAQFQLGAIYDGQGIPGGIPKDDAECVKWYRLAAENGNPEAQIGLGLKYDNGEGVPQDYVLAYKWFNLAAANLPSSEQNLKQLAIQNRNQTAAKMTPEQIALGQKLVREVTAPEVNHYNNTIQTNQEDADLKLEEIQQKQKELENKQVQMEIKENNDENWDALREMEREHDSSK